MLAWRIDRASFRRAIAATSTITMAGVMRNDVKNRGCFGVALDGRSWRRPGRGVLPGGRCG